MCRFPVRRTLPTCVPLWHIVILLGLRFGTPRARCMWVVTLKANLDSVTSRLIGLIRVTILLIVVSNRLHRPMLLIRIRRVTRRVGVSMFLVFGVLIMQSTRRRRRLKKLLQCASLPL